VVACANLDSAGLAHQHGREFLVQVASSFVGAIFTFLITSGFAPVLEILGGYVTDMRLLEMATLDHPLLKELSVQAPGTWNHSMVMGMMSEAAADAIGANPVLAKVGSYFHDIGKSKKPLYFVENQFGGENRHDRLTPSMSALIIRSHVKDGLDMARKYKLPEVLSDMISQHHGTSTIEYFFEKALKESEHDETKPEVDRTHYQYPGPKPQTKEAGILMLADGIEAASRTLSDPSFDRIQGMVQKMINKVFSSGQLQECELTLLDLHHIARCFTRILSGIHHHRIAYSEPVEKIRSTKDEMDDKKAEGVDGKDVVLKDAVGSKEGKQEEKLKRLGLQDQ
jgi:putative nucleotidyltransferase with HDIG domain